MEFEGKDKYFLRLFKIYGTKIHNLMEFNQLSGQKFASDEKKLYLCYQNYKGQEHHGEGGLELGLF